ARVLLRLALHQDMASGRLYVSNAKLVAGSNQSDRQVRLAIAKAIRLGSLMRGVHRGRGKANNYNLKNRNGDSGFIGKLESTRTKTPSKTGIGIPPIREEYSGCAEDRSNRPSMAELRAQYPDLLKPND